MISDSFQDFSNQISDRVLDVGEQGLLGLAFDPNYSIKSNAIHGIQLLLSNHKINFKFLKFVLDVLKYFKYSIGLRRGLHQFPFPGGG